MRKIGKPLGEIWKAVEENQKADFGELGFVRGKSEFSIEISVHRVSITLLSMDIVVERFLEIGVSDLLVSTYRSQDPLYLEL